MFEISFVYTNRAGETRLRYVMAESANSSHLQGTDTEIGQIRTFSLSNIENNEITILQTGEVVSLLVFCQNLPELVLNSRLPISCCIHFTGFSSQRSLKYFNTIMSDNKTV